MLVFRGALATICLLMATMASADEATARRKYDEAVSWYGRRNEAGAADKAIAAALAAEASGDTTLRYDARVLGAKAYYWGASHAAEATAHDLFAKGHQKAKEASDTDPGRAEARYWLAANLWRWWEARGILAGLANRRAFFEAIAGLRRSTTSDGKPGDRYEGYGADRLEGRALLLLPAYAGGSRGQALKHLRKAHEAAKDFALNGVWYAEALISGEPSDRRLARTVLDELLGRAPAAYPAARAPETKEELAEAAKLRAPLGTK